MKYQLHIIPTEKLSNLWFDSHKKKLSLSEHASKPTTWCKNKYLIITDDSDILKPCLVVHFNGTWGEILELSDVDEFAGIKDDVGTVRLSQCRKIIMSNSVELTPDLVFDKEDTKFVIRHFNDYGTLPNLDIEMRKQKSRCCGRCDGVTDECVTDMVCNTHSTEGCETCYGSRKPKTNALITWYDNIPYMGVTPKTDMVQNTIDESMLYQEKKVYKQQVIWSEGEKITCNKNGVIKDGESCTLNNNCIYPMCYSNIEKPRVLQENRLKKPTISIDSAKQYISNSNDGYIAGDYIPIDMFNYMVEFALSDVVKDYWLQKFKEKFI